MSQPFQSIECLEVVHLSEGEEIAAPSPGDFILTHGDAWTNKLIRFVKSELFHLRGGRDTPPLVQLS